MRRNDIAALLALLAAATAATSALAQQSEEQRFENIGNRLMGDQQELTQQNIFRATKALREKDYVAARKYAQPITRSDPKRVESWMLLGSAQLGLQEWKKARVSYATALRISPGNPEARAGLGVAMARTHDPKAQEQLAWLAQAQAACGPLCSQAPQLKKFRTDVETAIAEAAKTS